MGLSSEDVPLLCLVVLYGAQNLVLTIGISGHSSHEELPWLLAALKASERKGWHSVVDWVPKWGREGQGRSTVTPLPP